MNPLLLVLWSALLVSASTEHPHENEDDADTHHHHVHVNNDNEHHSKLYVQHHQAHQQPSTTSRVLELSDRFLEIVNSVMITQPDSSPKYQPWLVMFYAPWCGHCKRLEPIFIHVAQALHNTPIRVGRVDCTRFPTIGQEFKIHGYPTIMFISGPNRRSTFQGDREVDQIVNFAKRMNKPPVTRSSLSLPSFISTHVTEPPAHDHNPARYKREDHPTASPPDHSLFFGILKPSNYKDQFTDAFNSVAGKYQQWNEFYEFEHDSSSVTVFVYKHGRMLVFRSSGQEGEQNVTKELEQWVGMERHLDFMHLTRGNLYHVFLEGKPLIVVGVVNEDKLERVVNDTEKKLLTTLKRLTQTTIESTVTSTEEEQQQIPMTFTQIPHHYAWMGSPELANSMVADHLPLPTLLVIEKSVEDQNHKYYVFSDPSQFSTESKIQNIIELVLNNHFTPTMHANSWSFKLYRYAFDAKTSLGDMWAGNPVLTVVLFGLPFGFLSLILYSVCCGDIMDAKVEDDDEVDYDSDHEKRE